MNTQDNKPMEISIKYWNNANPTTTFVTCIVEGYKGLKDKFNKLMADRPDIDHVRMYWGNLQVAYWDRIA